MKTKKRVILDLDSKAMEQLDELKGRVGVKTRTALIRQALALLDVAEEMKSDGYKLQFRKGDTVKEVVSIF